MPITLTEQNWSEFWQVGDRQLVSLSGTLENTAELQPAIKDSWCSGSEQIVTLLGVLGRGREQCLTLRNGLSLMISDYKMLEDVTCDSHYDGDPYPGDPVISFVVSGNVRTIHHGITDHILEVPGKNYIEFLQGRETEDWLAGDRILKVRVSIKTEVLQAMSQSSTAALPKELKQLVEKCTLPPCYRQETTTPAMQVALQQILNCPYQGWTRQFYLESKALELLILWLTEAAKSDRPAKSGELSLSDRDRLQRAREILIERIDSPPSLIELARQVGLNDYKLKRGFRELFGTTVFGYLHSRRMEQAQQLLLQKQMKVTEVAYAVGYASLPSFSTAFRKRFGVSPKAYLA